MAIPPGELPDAAQALVDDLVHRGYTVKSEHYDEAIFGNFVIVADHGETAIRVIRDRGQLFVEIASAKGDDWFCPVIWRSFLESTEPPVDIVPLSSQLEWLLGHLDSVEVVNRDITETQLADLRSRRSRRAEARRLLPPTG
jgi:hypothetical protein